MDHIGYASYHLKTKLLKQFTRSNGREQYFLSATTLDALALLVKEDPGALIKMIAQELELRKRSDRE